MFLKNTFAFSIGLSVLLSAYPQDLGASEPNPDYFGTWVHQVHPSPQDTIGDLFPTIIYPKTIITITATEYNFTYIDFWGETFTAMFIISWTPVTNNDQDGINAGYTNGYLISGTITEASGNLRSRPAGWETGNILNHRIFLHTNKNSFSFEGLPDNIYYRIN